MILGIGIDSVEIERFAQWHTYQAKSLLRVFSNNEIAYCLKSSNKSAERFATRFAAKEAFLKALYPLLKSNASLSLAAICKQVSINNESSGAPYCLVNWNELSRYLTVAFIPKCHISLTHTRTTATAFVILEK